MDNHILTPSGWIFSVFKKLKQGREWPFLWNEETAIQQLNNWWEKV